MKTLKQLAEIVGGTIIGNHDIMIKGVGSVMEAEEGTITFAETAELHKEAEKSGAAAVIVPMTISQSTRALIQVEHPRLAYAQIAHEFAPHPLVTGFIHPTCMIDPDAIVREEVSIHPYVVIDAGARVGQRTIIGPGVYVGKDVEIGEDCEIHANVVLEYGTKIGHRVIIHAGTVLGSDGYGFVSTREGHFKVPQLGNVIVEDDVEIGANVTVDRGAIGPTRIGRGTKIDNLVHLAHNVEIGEECLIVAQSGVAGSTKMGRRITMAGQTGIFGHVRVGDNVTLAARSVITNNVESGEFLSGFPAIDHNLDYRIKAAQRRLPDLLKQVRELEKRLNKLESKVKE